MRFWSYITPDHQMRSPVSRGCPTCSNQACVLGFHIHGASLMVQANGSPKQEATYMILNYKRELLQACTKMALNAWYGSTISRILAENDDFYTVEFINWKTSAGFRHLFLLREITPPMQKGPKKSARTKAAWICCARLRSKWLHENLQWNQRCLQFLSLERQ